MKESNCKNCNKTFLYKPLVKTGTYCSLECTIEGQNKDRRAKFYEGKTTTRTALRRYLLELYGHKCVTCNLTEWLGDPIPLELDHIDGNAGNNYPENLRLLCPNCHAKTPTHKAKNKGNGRGSRGLPWR